jgi:chromate transporter
MSRLVSLANAAAVATSGHGVPFRDAVRVWVRVALLSFGGPAGQIAVMHRILVEEKRWIGETRFLHALNYCMLLPGPEAHQLAIYIGWLLHRTRGGLVAGTLFVLPGLVSLGFLSWVYAVFGNVGSVQALFFGLKTAVFAVVLEAVVRVGRRALRNKAMVVVAALAFVAIFLFAMPFPIVIAAAALIGLVGDAARVQSFRTLGDRKTVAGQPDSLVGRVESPAAIDGAFVRELPEYVRPSLRRFIKVGAIGLVVWLGPVWVLWAMLGADNVFTKLATFNSRMAIVTFGGAYAALAYMAQQAVEHYHWLEPQEMLVGLGFAETTPGPLISVVQFVGFMAAFRHPGTLGPVLAGTLGGLVAQWTTFVPSFVWIFAGAPYIEALRNNKALSAALTAITAAVVGVILNLAIWFGLHTLFGQVDERHAFGMMLHVPVLSTLSVASLVLCVAAMLALFRFKLGMIRTLIACSMAGVVIYLAGGSIAAAAEPTVLELESKLPLGEIRGRIDHLAIDVGRQRLYVAELGNDSVGVIDLKERKTVRTLTGLREPQGIAYVPSTDTVYVANAGDGSVRLFRGGDLIADGQIALGADADNVRVDDAAHRVFVGYGEGALAVIDVTTRSKVADIALQGHPESFRLENSGKRIFVNVPDAHAIAVLDRTSNQQVGSWQTGELRANFPLALDESGHLLAVFRHPARVGVLQTQDGRLLTSFDTCGDSDDVFLDASRHRLYVICGDGAIDVFAQSGDEFRRAAHITTVVGARTGLFVPQLDRLLVAARATAGAPAAIWVFRPLPRQ